MILFKQLRITEEGDRMIIDINVNNLDYHENIYIDSIYVKTADKMSNLLPDETESGYIYKTTFDGNYKEASLLLTIGDFMNTWRTDSNAVKFDKNDMSNTLFFVVVNCKELYEDDIIATDTVFKAVYDEKLLYQQVMNLTKELEKECSVPRKFIDFILQWNAFKASLETEHFIPAIKYWNNLFNTGVIKGSSIPISSCTPNSYNCYG